MAILSVLGKAAKGGRLERMRRSKQWKEGKFENEVPTSVALEGVSFFTMLREYRNRPKDTAPGQALPVVKTDLRALPEKGAFVVWFGHSSYLLKIEGTTILVDPVFSGHASPVSFMAKAFPGTVTYGVGDMPEIDILLLTHDHYDHLDYPTVRALIPKVKWCCTSLGVGAHLEAWGMEKGKIRELDWGETVELEGRAGAGMAAGAGGTAEKFVFTATPARHFSGRTFKRGTTLWSSFVLKGAGYSLFLGGDSGYEEHFKRIGDQYGPFDLAILECGQYGKNWPYIHMLPEQTVEAAFDLRAAALLPVHWAKFTLALHPWDEPIRRVAAAAAEKGMPLATPMMGEVMGVKGPYPDRKWWEMTAR